MNQSKGLYADTVFINGKVITVDDKNSVAFAVAVKNGLIQRVGNDEVVRETIGNKTKVINLEGKTLLPGLIDS
ncbi:MAG: amidohydrolase, partial [Candidatus Bathyarchaeota archaeon]